jgi:uncharacterized protein involved in outer membrane biogenesis
MTTEQHQDEGRAERQRHVDAPPGKHAKKPMGRAAKIALWIAGVLVAIPIIAIIVVATFDWNRVKPWLDAKVSDAIDRPFVINGNLAVHWERPASTIPKSERTWHDYIPWPHLYADDVHVGNPAGLPQQDMASVRQFSFSLDPFGLLGHSIHIPLLRFDAPRVDLLRLDATHYNWTFHHDDKKSKWKLDLERLVLARGVVHVKDAVTKADVTADVDTLPNDPVYGVGFKLHGTYNGAPVTGGGKTGGVLSLTGQDVRFPVQAEANSGPYHIALEGTVTDPAHPSALDLHVKLGGPSMARLYAFTGVLLPETPAFSTTGHLTASLGADSKRFTYDDFKGRIGESDVAGKFSFATGKPRNKLTGTVNSHQLRFADLGPMVGADSNASKRARGVDTVQPDNKALPVEKFKTERWKALDADVHFSADRIVKDAGLPLSKLNTHLVMNDGVLTLAPLNFNLAGGSVDSNIKLDGSHAGDTIKATAQVDARHVKIKQLFPKIEKMQATVGEINAQAKLSATGDSIAAMLAGANGEIKGLVSQGEISKLLLEEAGLNAANVVITKLFGDKQVHLNCVAADLGVKDGVATTRSFVLDTEEAIIPIDGWVNMSKETMHLYVKPETKGLRLLTFRTPFYVEGTFKHPDLSLDKKVLAMKGGAAVALATIAAPIAALLPLIDTGPGEQSPCKALLAKAKVPATAPPPGQSAKR